MSKIFSSLAICIAAAGVSKPAGAHPWKVHEDSRSLQDRIAPPKGFRRLELGQRSFGGWLRSLPLRSGRPRVRLHDGRLKANQSAHHAVLDIDVGKADLQQCADAAMRLRAEYLWASGAADEVCFRFTSGDPARWKKWKLGVRPRVRGNKVSWAVRAAPSERYRTFRRYLDVVFTYAGSFSLSREMVRVPDPSKIEPGDVFLRGGFPGHAVIVLDVAADETGARAFLLGQSFMPAQQIHVLKNPAGASIWYEARASGPLVTPEWKFNYTDLRRFASVGCPPPMRGKRR